MYSGLPTHQPQTQRRRGGCAAQVPLLHKSPNKSPQTATKLNAYETKLKTTEPTATPLGGRHGGLGEEGREKPFGSDGDPKGS